MTSRRVRPAKRIPVLAVALFLPLVLAAPAVWLAKRHTSELRSSRVVVVIVSLTLAVIYVGILRHLALDLPSLDAAGVQSRLDEMRSRVGWPFKPLPMLPSREPLALYLERDPFKPLETQGAEETGTP